MNVYCAERRPVDLVVLSDLHLGSYGCHDRELLQYLRSISPQELVLNGDIIDIWQFKKRYWPKAHTQIIKEIISFITSGTQVYYITGNHDENLRRYAGFELQNFQMVNKLVLQLDGGKKAWIFHGDVFDVSMKYSLWMAKLGAVGYDMLTLMNRYVNIVSEKLGYGKISLSKRIKNSVKGAVKFVSNFEETAARIAIENQFDFVVCGHIHQPVIRKVADGHGEVLYLNSGDWVENLTALEYHQGQWDLYHFLEDPHAQSVRIDQESDKQMSHSQLFDKVAQELMFL
jgi:UDP-2,3-diacylglucosamine pyrophosphatase LpxH